jgi:hypothetical protein
MMATRGVATTITYKAWNTSTQQGQTGDAGNHTLVWIKDGTPSTPTNSPAEVDAVNAPGLYKLALTASETDCLSGVLAGKSSTANVEIIERQVFFDHLPSAPPGTANGIATQSSVWTITIDGGLTAKQLLALIAAANAGKLSGAGTGTITIKSINDDNTNRISATVDNMGNRLTITLNPP